MDAVAAMKGAWAGKEILHRLAPGQGLRLDGLEGQVRRAAADFGDEGVKMVAGPDEDGDAALRPGFPGSGDQGEDGAGLGPFAVVALAGQHLVDADPGDRVGLPGGARWAVAHGAVERRSSAPGKMPGSSH